jgi:hypothetical protein
MRQVPAESVEDIAIREDRRLFLIAASEHPRIRLGGTLRHDVFLPLREMYTRLRLDEQPGFALTDEGQKNGDIWRGRQDELIIGWAQRNRLSFDWIREEARLQVSNWFAFPAIPAFTGMPGLRPPHLWLDSWFSNETERSYVRRMKQKFEDALSVYIREVQLSREVIFQDRGSLAAHYSWAAMRLCLAWTWKQVADYHTQTAVTVSFQAVSKSAGPILATLRMLTAGERRLKEEGFLEDFNLDSSEKSASRLKKC